MGEFVKVAKMDDIPSGEALKVEAGGQTLALVRVGEDVFCIHDICTHEHAHLSEGFCEGFEIECPLHGSIFDVRTGEVKSLPATEDLKTYTVKVEGGDVLVEVESS
ncbi:MAG: non-heme iron oxygenase ferredoxin subunit [Actinomycetota bacterium]